MSVALEFRLRVLWSEFFPDQAWPGDPLAALEYLAGEVRMLREAFASMNASDCHAQEDR
jgi:hypothetical protein